MVKQYDSVCYSNELKMKLTNPFVKLTISVFVVYLTIILQCKSSKFMPLTIQIVHNMYCTLRDNVNHTGALVHVLV